MQKRTRAELDELAKAVATRRIEIAEARARADMVEMPVPKPSQTTVGHYVCYVCFLDEII